MRIMMQFCLMLFLLGTVSLAGAAASTMLPRGYTAWAKSTDKVVTDKNSLFYGIHTIYVDKKALPAYRKGSGYPEGSQFVVEFFTIKDDGGKPVKGRKNMVVLMKRDRKQTATGGWLFAGFGADGKPADLDPVKNCFECHLKEAKDREFVFSRYADFSK